MSRSVERQVRVAYLGALGVLLVSGALTSVNMSSLASSVREVDESRRVIEGVSLLRSHVAESEAAAQAYLLTGDTAQIARYRAAIGALDTDLARLAELRPLVARDSAPTVLPALVRQRVATMERSLTLARTGQRDSAVVVMASRQILPLSDAIAREFSEFAVAERGRLQASRTDVLELLRLTLAVLGLGFALAVSITALATRRIEREMGERRKAEYDAVAAKEAAESANRAKTDFLARMSHELRTPLNSVIGFSTVLLKNRGGNLREPELMLLTRIHDNGLQLLQLIDDLLDLSRIEAGKQRLSLTELSLATVVRDAVAQLEERAAARELTLRAELPPVIAPIEADARKLRQVLLNLIANAIKFTDRGGVTVHVDVDDEQRPLRIRVTDTGIGIPESQQALIFGPFERGLHVRGSGREGTGLGLAIARSLCDVMGYDLTVESEVGVGSTFSIVMHPERARPGRPSADEVPVGAEAGAAP